MRICILQANRPNLDYLQLTRKVNEIFAAHYDYDYQFVDIPEMDNLYPATKKIYIVRDFLEKAIIPGLRLLLDELALGLVEAELNLLGIKVPNR
jgi:hypothetical protein